MSDKVINNKILLGILDEFKQDFGLISENELKSFEKLVSYVTLSKIDPDAFSDVSIFDNIDVDKTSTFGIDAFALFINDNLVVDKSMIEQYRKTKRMDIRFVFIQIKRSTTIDLGDFLKFSTAVKNFFSESPQIQLSDELKNAKLLVNELFKLENARIFAARKPKCELLYATTGINTSDSNVLGAFRQEEENIQLVNPEMDVLPIRHIAADYIIDAYSEIENSYIVNIEFNNNVACGKISDVEQSYLGFLPVSEFLKLITGADGNIRKNLFYENVRDFQGEDNPVNSEISGTLKDANSIDKFLLLNNGVTVVAKDFKNLRSNEYEISNYYIVNGCQTSNVIYKFRDLIKDNLSLYIPIKLIHTTSNELIAKLIRSTNRQTPVPDEAFVSLEKFHKRLQDFYSYFFEDSAQKLYYERRSKEFNNERIEKSRIFNLHSLIRSFTSIMLGEPQLAMSNNPSLILKEHRKKMFIEEHQLTPYFLSSFHLYTFYKLTQSHLLHTKYTIARYWVCWIANSIEFKTYSIFPFNSKEIDKKSQEIIKRLTDIEYATTLYEKAIKILENARSTHENEKGFLKYADLVRLKSFQEAVKRAINLEIGVQPRHPQSRRGFVIIPKKH